MVVNEQRTQDFDRDLAALKIKGGSSAGERPIANLGIFLIVVGVVLTVVANTTIVEESYTVTTGLMGIAITIAGGAIFLRYSLGRYLRFWLLRQIHEQRVQTDRLVAVLGRRAGEGGAVVESDATASADWPRVWPGPPGQAGPAGDATADPPQDAPPNAGGGDAPEK